MKQGEGPTKETARKLRADVIGRMWKNGTLDAYQHEAAREVSELYMVVMRALMPCRDPDAVIVDGGGNKQYATPLEHIPTRLYAAYRERYKPFAQCAGVKEFTRDAHANRITVLQIVLDVALDNIGTSQLDKHYGVRNGACKAQLMAALDDYCYLAGWKNRR